LDGAMARFWRERTAVLIVRAWTEGDADGRLRATVTSSLDIEHREEIVSAAASPEEVYAAVRVWLEAFLAE
jgi:hypothetical protein